VLKKQEKLNAVDLIFQRNKVVRWPSNWRVLLRCLNAKRRFCRCAVPVRPARHGAVRNGYCSRNLDVELRTRATTFRGKWSSRSGYRRKKRNAAKAIPIQRGYPATHGFANGCSFTAAGLCQDSIPPHLPLFPYPSLHLLLFSCF
jgi:hypothetical protein